MSSQEGLGLKQKVGESITKWADRVYQKCYRENLGKTDQELDRLAHWIFINGLQVESLRSELRKEPFVGHAVTVGLAIDLGISSATQPQPVTMRDDDDEAWSTTATIGEQNTRDAST